VFDTLFREEEGAVETRWKEEKGAVEV